MGWIEVKSRGKICLVILGLMMLGLSAFLVFNQGWSIWVFWLTLLLTLGWIALVQSTSIQIKLGKQQPGARHDGEFIPPDTGNGDGFGGGGGDF